MATADILKIVRDHPATVARTTGFTTAAQVLEDYETDNSVIFAALDLEALAAVQDAYNESDAEGLLLGVRDLLGLDFEE